MSKTYRMNGVEYEFHPYKQENQVRISGGAIDTSILLRTVWSALGTICDEKRYMEFAEGAGSRNRWRLKTALTLLGKVVQSTAKHTLPEQQEVVFANTFGQTITVGAGHVPQYTNLPQSTLSTIISAATGCDNCDHCIRSGRQIYDCPLKKALDVVPGMKDRASGRFMDMCPYSSVDLCGSFQDGNDQ